MQGPCSASSADLQVFRGTAARIMMRTPGIKAADQPGSRFRFLKDTE